MGVLTSFKAMLFGHEEQQMDNQGKSVQKVVMYSTRFCPFCMRARALLSSKQVPFKEIGVDGKPELREEMVQKAARYTVPQIWIGDTHVGGCEELMQLERTGELDRMLAPATQDSMSGQDRKYE